MNSDHQVGKAVEASWPDGKRGERSIAVCPEHGFVDHDHLQWDGPEHHSLCPCGETCEFVSVLPAASPQPEDRGGPREYTIYVCPECGKHLLGSTDGCVDGHKNVGAVPLKVFTAAPTQLQLSGAPQEIEVWGCPDCDTWKQTPAHNEGKGKVSLDEEHAYGDHGPPVKVKYFRSQIQLSDEDRKRLNRLAVTSRKRAVGGSSGNREQARKDAALLDRLASTPTQQPVFSEDQVVELMLDVHKGELRDNGLRIGPNNEEEARAEFRRRIAASTQQGDEQKGGVGR